MNIKRSALAIIALGLIASAFPVVAISTVKAVTNNKNWQQALSLGTDPGLSMLYGRLDFARAHYYTFTATKPYTMHVTIETDQHAPKNFQPRVVLYSPESITIGPALPMAQPPQTLAVAYPANAAVKSVEGPFLTPLLTKVDQRLAIETPGKYYLAIYDAGLSSGSYRLSVSTDNEPASVGFTIKRWWLTTSWFGPNLGLTILPLGLMIVAIGAWLTIHRLQPRPVHVLKPRTKRRTIHHGRIS